MKIYMVRHGQSTRNAEKCISGWEHVPLTASGEADAVRVGGLLQGIRFDKVYSSDILRAKQTCMLALPDAQPELSMLLREIDVGTLAGMSIENLEARQNKAETRAVKERDYRPFGGENTRMQMDRLNTFLDALSKENFERVAVFCHQGVVDCMLQIATEARWRSGICENGSVSVFEKTGSGWRLVKWNITGTLD